MVSRNDLLKQAEKVMEELGNSKALLEVQYENEVRSEVKYNDNYTFSETSHCEHPGDVNTISCSQLYRLLVPCAGGGFGQNKMI